MREKGFKTKTNMLASLLHCLLANCAMGPQIRIKENMPLDHACIIGNGKKEKKKKRIDPKFHRPCCHLPILL
jgi:hypothetical protein